VVPGGRVRASPLARKIAAGLGLDIATVAGTGPGGRIVRQDVERVAAQGGAPKAAALPGSGSRAPVIRPSLDFDPGAKRIPLTGMRTIIAERLQTSKSTIPHFYLNVELDAEPLMVMRKEVNESGAGHKYTVNDFVLKAVIMAAVEVSGVNAAWDGDAIVQYAAVNLAVAIAIPDGLVTPVLRNAHGKTLLEISREVKDLAERARNKKLSPAQFVGGTLTVSNLGAYGIDSFDAIINPPQAVILSIGSIRKMPVVTESGELGVGQRMWIGMSCDHRVVDGAVGATYLQALRKYLENPALMLV
jgi:pyruvate dehydrogenase E2 component (dihydrolipoamide acetyltransferase)